MDDVTGLRDREVRHLVRVVMRSVTLYDYSFCVNTGVPYLPSSLYRVFIKSITVHDTFFWVLSHLCHWRSLRRHIRPSEGTLWSVRCSMDYSLVTLL